MDTFGDVFFRHEVEVRIDGDLALLKDLSYLRNLSLSGLQITDAGLLYPKGMQNLKSLQLDTGAYTAKEILKLKQALPNLDIPHMDVRPHAVTEEESAAEIAKVGADLSSNDQGFVRFVNLCPCELTIEDTHLELIARFRQLEWLEIHTSKVSGDGLKHLVKCVGLKSLRIDSSELADDDLKYLENLVNLKSLTLSFASIHGNGLAHLAGLDKLEDLSLSGNPLENQYLQHLKALPALRTMKCENAGYALSNSRRGPMRVQNNRNSRVLSSSVMRPTFSDSLLRATPPLGYPCGKNP